MQQYVPYIAWVVLAASISFNFILVLRLVVARATIKILNKRLGAEDDFVGEHVSPTREGWQKQIL